MGDKLYYAGVLAERNGRWCWKWRTERFRWLFSCGGEELNLYKLSVGDTGNPLAFCVSIRDAISWTLGFEAGFTYAAQVGG